MIVTEKEKKSFTSLKTKYFKPVFFTMNEIKSTCFIRPKTDKMYHSSSPRSSKKHSCTPQKSISPKRIRTLSPLKHSPASFSANDNTTSSNPEDDLIHKFNNTFRYLGDILALNNDDFSMYTKEIYPVELTLNKAYNNNNFSCLFIRV